MTKTSGGYNLPVRRLGRYIFNALAVLSLLLAVATLALGLRSYFVADAWVWSDGYEDSDLNFWAWSACSQNGGVSFSSLFHLFRVGLFNGQGWRIPAGRQLRWLHVATGDAHYLGYPFRTGTERVFTSRHENDGNVDLFKELTIPFPALSAAFSILPAARARRWLRLARERRRGLCARCGYDLRATPDRCPECVRVPVKGSR